MRFLEIFDTNKTARVILYVCLVLNLFYMLINGLVAVLVLFIGILFTATKAIIISPSFLFLSIAPTVVFISTLFYFLNRNKSLLIAIVLLSLPFYIISLYPYL